MKYLTILLLCITAFSCASGGAAKSGTGTEPQIAVAGSVNLDTAISDFSSYIAGRRMPEATLTAVAVMNTPVQQLGNFIADKLTDSLLNNTGLHMVSRQDIKRVFSEQNIQAGSFNDDTTARIGRNLGWKSIIYGTVDPLSEAYHLSLRAVNVETGELYGSKSYVLVGNDPILVNLVNPNISVQRLTERESILTPFNGDQNDFNIKVSTNKSVYYDQENMQITLISDTDCHFVVFHLDIDSNMQVIYPNRWEMGNNQLIAGVPRIIPENTSFLLHEPYGEERILVYASDQPINIPEDQYSARSLSTASVESAQEALRGDARGLSVRPKGATGQVSYSILPK